MSTRENRQIIRTLMWLAALVVAVFAMARSIHNNEVKAQSVGASSEIAASATRGGGNQLLATWQPQPPTLTPEIRAASTAAQARSHRGGPTNLSRAGMVASGPVGPEQLLHQPQDSQLEESR